MPSVVSARSSAACVTLEDPFRRNSAPKTREIRTPTVTVSPPTDDPTSAIHINNGTTLKVSVRINGSVIAVVAPEAGDVAVIAARVATPPWRAEVRTSSGRVLGSLTVPNTTTDYGLRLDPSCDRIDVRFGGPLLGGSPRPGASGDRAPQATSAARASGMAGKPE